MSQARVAGLAARAVGVAAGVWLMAAPAVLDFGGAASTNARVVGPVVASIAIIAAFPVVKGVRLALWPLAGWLVVAPIVLTTGGAAAFASVVAGIATAVAALVEGAQPPAIGGGWWALRRQ